jgi:hypothetical protein
MEDHIDATVEPRKDWVSPELKKIGVEEITAGFVSTASNDASGFS